ncbi:sensor histidine kinase [Anatilimnocola aggregata]|nr:HAMP domain-containing sensor histidine kinase [Anatilimnocola aggregata]
MPLLLQEICKSFRASSDQSIAEALRDGSAFAHGLQRVQDAFDIEEVVAEYNILRCCIHDVAEENGLNLQGIPFRIINRVLDQAIGVALQTYSTERAAEVLKRREEYLAFVAHDLRTPLNAISLAGRILEVSQSGQEASEESVQVLKALRRSVKQLEGMVDKILEENANLQTELGVKLERREFDLWPLVEGLIHDLHPVAGTSSTKLVNKIPGDLVVYADAGLLRRVFQNLIANAIKYTPRGQIVIDAREATDGKSIECSVTDNGTGIPPELIDKVFEKGETDPHNVGGLGLGLAIVKTFIEAHEGNINVSSGQTAGTVFVFTLPGKAAS